VTPSNYVPRDVVFWRTLLQTIDYEGFRRFMYIYLDSADMPDELYRHLFLSFIKRPSTLMAVGGDCSAVGGRPNGDAVGPGTSLDAASAAAAHESPSRLSGLAEKLHGLTEKLHNLGGSGAPPSRRHRAGTWFNNMLAIRFVVKPLLQRQNLYHLVQPSCTLRQTVNYRQPSFSDCRSAIR